MLKFSFNKLVRDKIVDQQIASGAKPNYRTLTNDEHIKALVSKIIEEAGEIPLQDKKSAISEIADVQQAVDDLVEKYGLETKDITQAKLAKYKKVGSFKKGVFVEYIEIEEDDKWVKYYRNNPDRYPELP